MLENRRPPIPPTPTPSRAWAKDLDLREVQDVVDDAEQGAAGALHAGREPLLLRGERRAQQQVVEPDHTVERRPDLVAHRGEELRLLPRRLHRLVPCLREQCLGVLALRHPGQLLGHPGGHLLDELETPQGRRRGDHDDGLDLVTQEDREREGQLALVPDGGPLVEALLGEGEVAGREWVADVRVPVRVGRVERHHQCGPAGLGGRRDERAGPLPVVVHEHEVTSVREHVGQRPRPRWRHSRPPA